MVGKQNFCQGQISLKRNKRELSFLFITRGLDDKIKICNVT